MQRENHEKEGEMNTVVAITSGTKLVYSRNAKVHGDLLDYRATIVGREWRGKQRVLTLFLPKVRVTSGSGGVLYVTFPEFKKPMILACDDDPLEILSIPA
ncbi:hypothetical protein HY412_00400 [Candidatus Kaiserbacteria bacterium]|nr:hypothetical protein [Candidatus Kaiserbacteria bacterium]